jgi:hypothetical protein
MALGRAPTSLHWLIYLMTGTLLWQRLNSRPKEGFPSTNFTNGALTCPAHGDSGHRGHSNVFPAILGTLAQLDGSESIQSIQGHWNEDSEDMNGSGIRSPRWGLFRGGGNTDWGMSNSQFLVNDWRQLLVLWMRNYPMELTTCSIYSRHEWWIVNLDWDARRPKRKRALSRELGGFRRGELTGD